VACPLARDKWGLDLRAHLGDIKLWWYFFGSNKIVYKMILKKIKIFA